MIHAGPIPRRLVILSLAVQAAAFGCTVTLSEDDADLLGTADVPTVDLPAADAPPDLGYGYVQDVAGVDIQQAFLPEPPAGREWRLIFDEEFDGTAIDTARWEVSNGKGRTNVYDPRALVLDGSGILTLRTFEESGTYYTGGLSTQGRWHKAKGYFETRVKFQKQPGHWTAFWFYSETICAMENGGKDGAELDVFERPWTIDPFTEFTQRTVHWDCHKGKKENPQPLAGVDEGWHTWGMWWSDDAYIFYTDGVETWRSTDGGICEVPLYMLLTDEIQDGIWFGAGSIKDAVLPDEWFVDYVRVFDLSDSSALPAVSPR